MKAIDYSFEMIIINLTKNNYQKGNLYFDFPKSIQ